MDTEENKWIIADEYDEDTIPLEKGYYRVIDTEGNEFTDYYFGEPRMTVHGITYWRYGEFTVVAFRKIEKEGE